MKNCSDCNIQRTKPPTPGSCPCCFNKMKAKTGYANLPIYRCTNSKCRRICTADYLSGFWSGWKEKEIHTIDEIKKTNIPIVSNEDYPPSWWSTDFGMSISHEISRSLCQLIERITTKSG